MKFVKFNSIDRVENIVPSKDRLYQHAIENATQWVITEKIDGSNFSIIVERGNPEFEIARRNDILVDGEDMWNLVSGKDRFNKLVEDIRQYMETEWCEFDQINVYGEWFGKGIMKRVFYGDGRYYRLFNAVGVKGDDIVPLAFNEFQQFIDHFDLNDIFVPVLAVVESYEQAIKYKNDLPSVLSPTGSIMEGIIIEPLDVRTPFKVKSKNELYAESTNHPKAVVIRNGDVERLHNAFMNYITLNRMYTVFSKLGYPREGVRAANKYLTTFVKDAVDDFVADHPDFKDAEIEARDRRYITNVGSEGFKLFSRVLKELAD